MPPLLFWSLFAASLLLIPFAVLLNARLTKGDSRHRGLILPTILAAIIYTAFALLVWRYGSIAFLLLLVMNLPLLASVVIYLAIRMNRYTLLFEEYKKQKRSSKPTLATTTVLNAALEGFTCATTLSNESLREVVILIKSGTAHEKIAATYDCPLSEIKHIEKSFDRYRAEKEENKIGGEAYTVSGDQGEFFLQLMVNASPKSLGCGEFLLWNAASVAELIRLATQIKPSRKSVAAFLTEIGLVPKERDMEITKTNEANAWTSTEYQKIRMSALERDAKIVWVFAPKPATARRYLILCAVRQDGSSSFGVYRGSGGFVDFLNKLAQETAAPLYAVICTDYKHYKNLDALAHEIALFPLGEKAKIPE